MLDNTRKALDKVKRDIAVIKWIFMYGTNIMLSLYLCLSLVFKIGDFAINVAMFSVSVVFLLFNLIYGKKEMSKKRKKAVKRKKEKVNHVLKVLMIFIKAVSLGMTLYAMYIAVETVSPVSIVLTTILIIFWLVGTMVEIIDLLFDFERDRVINGVKEDFEWFSNAKNVIEKKVVQVKTAFDDKKSAIQNFFKKDNSAKG